MYGNRKRTFHRRRKGRAGRGARRKNRFNRGSRQVRFFNTRITGMPMPNRIFTTFKYSTAYTVSGITTVPSTVIFNGNSIWDPDRTSAGHQPYMFDELSAIYNDYRVYACKMQLTFTQTSGTVNPVMIVVRALPYGQADSTNLHDVIERGQCKWRSVGASPDTKTITYYRKSTDVFGISKAMLRADPDYSTNTGATPNSWWAFNVMTQSQDGVSSAQGEFLVRLTYYTELFGLKTPIAS